MDYLASARADDGSADQGAIGFGNDFYKTIVDVAGVGAPDDADWYQRLFNLNVTLDALVFGQAAGGDFGVGKDDAWHCPVIYRHLLFSPDVVSGQAALVDGHVGEHVGPNHVTS